MAGRYVDYDVELLTTSGEMMKQAEEVASEAIQDILRRAIYSIRRKVGELVAIQIRAQPEWESLVGDSLRELLGIADAKPVLEGILRVILDNMRVELIPRRAGILGGLVVKIIRADFRDVLEVPGTSYVSVSQARFSKGTITKPSVETVIPWLEWLLFRGNEVILATAEVNTRAEYRRASRTGRAIMVHPVRRPSVGFRIPAEFSGIIENNFLTRALESQEDAVLDIMLEEVYHA